jgi:lysophospholipase L1-like esterase
MKRILSSLLGLGVAYLTAEAAAFVTLWIGWGQLPGSYDRFIGAQEGLIAKVTNSYRWDPHPYLGFRNPTRMIDLDTVQNSNKSYDEFWVGILGGSFAGMLAGDPSARSLLETQLGRLPATANRKVRLLQLAHGGYKQPQQLLLYTLYGAQLDLVINLEGVNEVSYFMLGHHFPMDFPETAFRYHYREPVGQIYLQMSSLLLAAIYHGYPAYQNASLLPLSPLVTLAMFTLIKGGQPLHHLLQDQFQKKYFAKFPEQPRPANPEVIREQLTIWERAIRTQAELANARQVPLFVFVQPNQYIENSKPFSALELAQAISPGKSTRANSLAALRERAQDLSRAGLPVYDLTQVFSETKETVYIDSCCHINSLGNQIVAQAIADRILQTSLEATTQKTSGKK